MLLKYKCIFFSLFLLFFIICTSTARLASKHPFYKLQQGVGMSTSTLIISLPISLGWVASSHWFHWDFLSPSDPGLFWWPTLANFPTLDPLLLLVPGSNMTLTLTTFNPHASSVISCHKDAEFSWASQPCSPLSLIILYFYTSNGSPSFNNFILGLLCSTLRVAFP